MTVLDAAQTGDEVVALEAMRDRLAAAMDEAPAAVVAVVAAGGVVTRSGMGGRVLGPPVGAVSGGVVGAAVGGTGVVGGAVTPELGGKVGKVVVVWPLSSPKPHPARATVTRPGRRDGGRSRAAWVHGNEPRPRHQGTGRRRGFRRARATRPSLRRCS